MVQAVEGSARRIPYRPQASLLNLLLQDEGIAGEVQASTAHICQGEEAEFVIVDLTVDEPHYATNLTSANAGSDIRRLLNVAMTRAERRLMIVGNSSWLPLKGRGAFMDGELLPYLLGPLPPPTFGRVFARLANGG